MVVVSCAAMFAKRASIVMLASAACVLSVDALYSSFYEPLFKPRVLRYKVDVNFNPQDAISMREQYMKRYGYRGERLIAALGNGGLTDGQPGHNVNNIYGDVNFYYTDDNNYNNK